MENTLGSIDVPLTLFQGLNTEVAPSDVPQGQSPDNQDVVFKPGSVASRPCLSRLFLTPMPDGATVVYAKTYVQPSGDPLNLFLDSNGFLWKEDVNNSPGTYTEITRVPPGSIAVSETAFGREYLAISDGEHGAEQPLQFDGENIDRVSQDGVGAPPTTVADSATVGNISAGVHQVVVMFLTRQGYIVAPSTPSSWTAAGNFKVQLTGIPLGPPNVIARILAFTGAGGDNFFTILTPVTFGGLAISATIIPDNTTTTGTFDFSDLGLLAATAIDIPGNNLFELRVLGPSLFVSSYASRMFWGGERNNIPNLLNMGFEGGYLVLTGPLGWTVDTAGGLLIDSEVGMAWQVTGDGSVDHIGQITQDAYQDFYGIPILLPGTQYTFRLRAKASAADLLGQIVCEIYSASSGVLATANIDIEDCSTIGAFIQADFNAETTAVLPSDVQIRVYVHGQDLSDTVTLDEMEIIYTADPYRQDEMIGSYVNNPESFDAVTGVIGPASDPNPLRGTFQIRETLYLQTSERLHETADNGTGEPSTWDVRQIAEECGLLSVAGRATGDTWAAWASRVGALHFSGGAPKLLSGKIQPDWKSINAAAEKYIWSVNDQTNRRIYFGLPVNEAETPNLIYPFDYLEIDNDISVPGEGQVTKWTRFDILADCGAILARPDGVTEFCIGSGDGEALSSVDAVGNLYKFDPDKFTDDDLGQMAPYYTTYFFADEDGTLGSHRKLAAYLSFFATGTGKMRITVYAGSLSNAVATLPLIPLSQNQNYELEVGLNVLAERIALKFAVEPQENSTDVNFELSKIVLTMKKDPWSPVRGSI